MFGQFRETLILQRDVDAITVPDGETITLTMGSLAVLVQALGGSFTITQRGNMFRIDGQDADAIGKELPLWPDLEDGATDTEIDAAVWETLETVYDPEIPVSIVALGLVYRCEIKKLALGRMVEVDMTLTAPGCGMGPVLVHDVRSRLQRLSGIAMVEVNLIFDPPWTRERMSEEAQLETGLF